MEIFNKENLKDLKLLYKSTLEIEENFNFGIETEFTNETLENIKTLFNKNNLSNWEVKPDNSVTEDEKVGGETASPILQNTISSWKELKKALELIRSTNAKISSLCATHIHVSPTILTEDYITWLNFFKLWTIYEPVIFNFSKCAWPKLRQNAFRYAMPLHKEFFMTFLHMEEEKTTQDLISLFTYKKNSALNLNNIKNFNFENKNTIEFRTLNSTLNEELIQNSVNFFLRFMLYAKSNNFDTEFINYKIKNLKNIRNPKITYKKLFIQECLELMDLIFPNDNEKVDFLLQFYQINLPNHGILEEKVKKM